MIDITGSQNPANVEDEIRQVVAAPGERLRLPVRPHEWWLGGELALIELAITWARNTENSVLATHVPPADNPTAEDPAGQLASMARRMFGFVALMMAQEILDRTQDPNRSLRPNAYDQCRQVVEKMFRPISEFDLGDKVFLICVDHSTQWKIPSLYSDLENVRDLIAFTVLARELLERTKLKKSLPSPVPEQSIRRIGAILHELFENTDKFAKTDHDEVPWRRSVRGLSVEGHGKSEDQLTRIGKGNAALQGYFESVKKKKAQTLQHFLEITVFDSGIGLARRWLKANWSRQLKLEDEYAACMACLTKNSTSAPERGRGLGLAEVMTILNNLDGFLKLRTGRLSLYRDFATKHLQSPTDVELRDFPSCSAVLTELAAVFGTHYQILIPV